MQTIIVETLGPQGPPGPPGPSIDTGSFAVTSSNTFIGNQVITGSVTATLGFTGSFSGFIESASYALTSSYSDYADYAGTADLASRAYDADYAGLAGFTDNAVTASYALTASYVEGISATASYALQALSASYAANVPATASYALHSLSSSYSLNADSAFTSTSASYALTGPFLSSVVEDTSPELGGDLYLNNFSIRGTGGININGNIQGNFYTSQLAPTSGDLVMRSSIGGTANGAKITLDGDSTDANIVLDPFGNGIVQILSSVTASSFTGSLKGDVDGNTLTATSAQTATTASYSLTASYVETAQTASYVQLSQTASYVQTAQTASYVENTISASYALTASYASNIPVTASYAIQALSSSYATTGPFATLDSNTFIGNQTITGSIVMQGNISTGNISQTFTGTSVNADFFPLFASSISTNQYAEAHSGLKYNPSTGTLNAIKFTGSFAGTLATDLNAQSFARVINLPNPSNNGDVANKIYVDSQTIYLADNHLVYYRNTDTNVNSSTDTVLDWNATLVTSTIPDFTHSSGVFTNTSTRTRRFLFQMQVAIRTQATNFTEADIWFSYNGTFSSTNRRGQTNYVNPSGTNAIMLTTSWTFTLAQNETVRGYFWCNQASIYGNTSPGSSFGNAYSSLIEVQELN